MPLDYYTVLQVADDLVPTALAGFEEMTRTSHPSAMRQVEQMRQAARDEGGVRVGHDSARLPVLRHTQALPLRSVSARPEISRRSTAPESAVTEASDTAGVAQPRPRNRSPYSRAQLRPRSAVLSGSSSQPTLATYAMPARAPSPGTLSPSPGSLSPVVRSPNLSHSPFRPSSPQNTSPFVHEVAFETIAEHAELDLSRRSLDSSRPMTTLNSSARAMLAPRRPRTASPSRSPLTSSASSPSLSMQRYNDGSGSPSTSAQALLHQPSSASLSSMPSTPSTTRSRSPSISSLETIEDVPDAEWEALEVERIARLKAAEERDGEDDGGLVTLRRSGSLDIPATTRGFGFARLTGGTGSARKRWSVCGAERRADLDLETIWED